MDINKIVIVGGGSSGWMTATHINKMFPEKEITVIESPDFPTVGVGESTLQQIRLWCYAMCMEDEDWMPHCDASYKVSIKFNNWDGKGTTFHYPFGPCVYNDPIEPTFFALDARDSSVKGFADMFFPAAEMDRQNKMVAEMEGWSYKNHSAFHFDATMFGQWLKNSKCLPCGVNLISDSVTKVNKDGNHITSLEISSGEEVTADLFIDCTGFKSLLMSEMDNEYVDYGYALPNNKAWATRIPGESKGISTTCTTLKNGWVWQIPTATRTGSGYVYSDKYTTDDEALEEFKEYLGRDDLEFQNISFKTGRYNKLASGNVAAIGLSYGFIEPLESNGLFTVHENLFFLEKAIRSEWSHGVLNAVNQRTGMAFDQFATFVYAHYTFATRNDSPYWKEVGSVPFEIEPVSTQLISDCMWNEVVNVDESNGMMCVALGNGFNPCSKREPVLHSMFTGRNIDQEKEETMKYLVQRKNDWVSTISEAEAIPRKF